MSRFLSIMWSLLSLLFFFGCTQMPNDLGELPTIPLSSIQVINNSSFPLCSLFIPHSSESFWGGNYLGGTSTIAVGSSVTVNSFSPGTYHIVVMTTNHAPKAVRWAIKLAGTDYIWTVTDSSCAEGAVRVVNNSAYPIYYFYLSSDTLNWGNDVLGSSILRIHDTLVVNGISAGTYNFKASSEGSAFNGFVYAAAIDSGSLATWTFNSLFKITDTVGISRKSSQTLAKVAGVSASLEPANKTVLDKSGEFHEFGKLVENGLIRSYFTSNH